VIFQQLLRDESDFFMPVTNTKEFQDACDSKKTGILAAIENASGLCEEDEPLERAFQRLERYRKLTGCLSYLSLTHHGENRFGGGNNSKAGLKNDGKVLMDYLDGREIAVDLSHTSTTLAYDILDYIDKKNLNIPVIASHSNFRAVYDHARNLPDEIAAEIILRRGLIGMNFLRAFVHPDDPKMLTQHIQYGFELGAKDTLCFGADFFHWKSHPDKSRIPFFFSEYEHAGKYQEILRALDGILNREEQKALAFLNAMNFIRHVWSTRENTSKQMDDADR
jgi:membrane dipeptidase